MYSGKVFLELTGEGDRKNQRVSVMKRMCHPLVDGNITKKELLDSLFDERKKLLLFLRYWMVWKHAD